MVQEEIDELNKEAEVQFQEEIDELNKEAEVQFQEDYREYIKMVFEGIELHQTSNI